MKLYSVAGLLVEELNELYSAEVLLLETMPSVINHVQDSELSSALTDHLEETRKHMMRLREIAHKLDARLERRSAGIVGWLLQNGMKKLESLTDSDEINAATISMMHKIEQYEIAAYSTATAFAELLGENLVQNMLNLTLDEETLACETLTDIATYIDDDDYGPEEEVVNLDQ